MSKSRITLEVLDSFEELACACQDAWELEYGCLLGEHFDCPFFGIEKRCYAVTAEMWEAACITDYEEDSCSFTPAR